MQISVPGTCHLAPKGSNWCGGATPNILKDLEVRDAISIPTAPTNLLDLKRLIRALDTNKAFDTN